MLSERNKLETCDFMSRNKQIISRAGITSHKIAQASQHLYEPSNKNNPTHHKSDSPKRGGDKFSTHQFTYDMIEKNTYDSCWQSVQLIVQ